MGCSTSVSTMNSSGHHNNTKPTVMPSSQLSIPYKNSKIIEKRNRRTDSNEIIQNFLLVWLDAQIDESTDDFRNSIKHLRQTVNTIEIFDDDNECINYITQIQKEKAFLIISGALCQIQQLARQCDEDSVTISAIKSLNQIEPSFMYTQLFKEVILEINFDRKNEIQALVQYVRKKYESDDNQLKIIDEFATEYRDESDGNNRPIWWYTRECFTYSMLNKALGVLQVDTLLKMGIFMRDLHQNITKLHAKQLNETFNDSQQILTVYRGKTMLKEDFENKIKQGGLMSFNNFLSTSDNRAVALDFISKGLKSADPKKVGVLFEMTIDQKMSSAQGGNIVLLYFKVHKVYEVQRRTAKYNKVL
ncbi:unnamed protein product [Rotaria sordida]|uniref:Uncharacterized protein n=1 Tax=Rotaria sordida TaxID=392033 RepID=A0A819EA57_9BILA|nr:unnamed protein product [Rotaria sordida]